MFRKCLKVATLFSALACSVFAQGLDTRATKDDWEEINFEFNSAVLTDGFPSLLRLADVLKANPLFKVRVEGHTDGIGGERANEKLGMARADAVRDFLVKYGARPNQIEALSRGKKNPAVSGEKSTYSKTDVARWMNRRVVLTAMDGQGRTVGAGGPGDAIRGLQAGPGGQTGAGGQPGTAGQMGPGGQPGARAMSQTCCDEILKRLDKLDEIARMLKELADQNAGLRREVDNLKQQQAAAEAKASAAPKPLTEPQTAQVVKTEIEKSRDPRFSLLGMNVGADNYGHATFSGKARYFAPFKEHFAVQAQGEYYYWRESREGQFDLGLVNRIGNFQAGLFGSLKHVTLRGNQQGGSLGQGSATFDYLFKLGKVGVFGSKGFMNSATIDSRNAVLNGPNGLFIAPNLFIERYLSIVDQVGASTTLGLWKNNYLEANLGYLKSRGAADRPGGTLRFVFPINSKVAFTVEGGMNETLLDRGQSGRAVFGVQLGNFIRPREFVGIDHPVPVDVPRVRYEVLQRQVRKGASPPIADAGPDQIGIAAGSVTLNGSNSYDPNGEKLTYTWVQEGGPNVAISGAAQAVATFAATSGQSYSFRLTVRNESGLTAAARARVTTKATDAVQILFFVGNPPVINQGQAAELSWKVLNADTVEISDIGKVAADGKVSVSPRQTTTYRLTARNSVSEQNATATITVNIPRTQILGCYATPVNINAGEAATVNFQTEHATRVTVVPEVGPVGNTGSFVVSPAQTTTYLITAFGAENQSASCSVTVTVNPRQTTLPRIIRFTATPATIVSGQTSTLLWEVEGADSVIINPVVGAVRQLGTADVQPAATTTYTLTAINKVGSSTATALVTVIQPARITSFTANPPVSPAPGLNVLLTCLAENATSVSIAGAGPLAAGTVVVNPKVDTTYTCTATGNGTTDSRSLLVKVTQPPIVDPPPPPGPPPVVVITGGPVIETVVRTLRIDASQSSSPAGHTPLKYFWTSREGRAAIADATLPNPIVYLGNLAGSYFFDLTVTDSRGQVSTGSVEVKLVVTRVP